MIRISSNLLRCSASLTVLVLIGMNAHGENLTAIAAKKISLLKTRAERGFVQQEVELANAYFSGDGVPRDNIQAAHWYEKAAEAGHAGAQNQIGYFYEAGIGVPVNMERSVHWFQLAAASGSTTGIVNLALAYLSGQGIPKNVPMAEKFLTEAFHKGSGTAASYLGDMYYFGLGAAQNRDQAESWYDAGLKLHDPMAAYRMGTLYSVAGNHTHDLHRAAELLRASAEGGYVPAMYSLGFLLVDNPDLAKWANEARPWLEEAANDGNWRASVVLGILNRDGRGVPIDDKAAYLHFQVAARQGGAQAQSIVANDLSNIGAKLGADTQSEVTAAADAWFAQHSQALLYIDKKVSPQTHFPAVGVTVAPPGSFVGQLVPLTAPVDPQPCPSCAADNSRTP